MPYVAASVALIAVWLWMFSRDGIVNQVMGPLAPDPSWLVNRFWAMPIIAFSPPGSSSASTSSSTWQRCRTSPRAVRSRRDRRGRNPPEVPLGDRSRVRQTTTLVVIVAFIVGANFFTEPYLLTGGGGPNGASMSPVLLMYQKGIEQGMPASVPLSA